MSDSNILIILAIDDSNNWLLSGFAQYTYIFITEMHFVMLNAMGSYVSFRPQPKENFFNRSAFDAKANFWPNIVNSMVPGRWRGIVVILQVYI